MVPGVRADSVCGLGVIADPAYVAPGLFIDSVCVVWGILAAIAVVSCGMHDSECWLGFLTLSLCLSSTASFTWSLDGKGCGILCEYMAHMFLLVASVTYVFLCS